MMKKILVADDDKDLGEVIKTALEIKGFEVATVYDGEEVLKEIRRVIPDLITLDITMPGLNGFEVLQRIREDPDFNSIPVILLTVKDGSDNTMKGYKFGADYYLPKPFKMEELLMGIKMMFKY